MNWILRRQYLNLKSAITCWFDNKKIAIFTGIDDKILRYLMEILKSFWTQRIQMKLN